MTEYPIWVWVIGVLGTIAAGIGLGYLIIFLFWKIEKYFSPPVVVKEKIQPEQNLEEEPEEILEQPEVTEEPAGEEENIEIMEQKEEEEEEEVHPVAAGMPPGEQGRMIKFATVLRSSFNYPFQKTNRIVCWDIALENGAEVRDSEGNIMTFRVIQPQSEGERIRYFLTDETGEPRITVINGKEYVSAETKIDFDKMKI
jgi:hypothetical protein